MAKKKISVGPPGGVEPPSREELVKLPRWARVAFAARCARRVQPLFLKHWPSAPKEHVEALDKAITLAETAARSGRAAVFDQKLTTAAASANAAADAAADAADAA
ncbi:MAG: hypothetical protein ACKVT1_08805, partial [Dehalococcoidia bacterium]